MLFRRWFQWNNNRITKSKLEHLPNEFFFQIFDYLYYNEILSTFNKLNFRFQSLLYSYSSFHLTLSYQAMKLIFQLHEQFSFNTEHVKSLKLFNSPYSMLNNNKFFLKYPLRQFFSTLQCLTIHGNADVDQITSLLLSLNSFQQLKFFSVSHDKYHLNNLETAYRIRDIILFEIKTLKHLVWNMSYVFSTIDYSSTFENKSTIEYYTFKSLTLDQLEWLNSNTKLIKSVQIFENIFQCSIHQSTTWGNLFCLKLGNIKSKLGIEMLFEHLKDLKQLKKLECDGQIEFQNDFFDGYLWESFIEIHIPQLEILKFFFILSSSFLSMKNLDEVIQSFMTNFWLIVKCWFITFDYDASLNKTYFYTEHCLKTQLEYSPSLKQISTTKPINTSNIS